MSPLHWPTCIPWSLADLRGHGDSDTLPAGPRSEGYFPALFMGDEGGRGPRKQKVPVGQIGQSLLRGMSEWSTRHFPSAGYKHASEDHRDGGRPEVVSHAGSGSLADVADRPC